MGIDEYITLINKHKLSLGLAASGLILVIYGIVVMLPHNNMKEDIKFDTAFKDDSKQKDIVNEIVVDVEGAINKPGIYTLTENSRVADIINQSGGFSGDVDKSWVAKHMNLAAKLNDGAKVYVPFEGEKVSSAVVRSTSSSDGVVTLNNNGNIDINSASSDQLDSLSGIGPVTAKKIIDNRPYTSIDDLVKKKIVSQKVFDRIKSNITVNE